MLQGYEPLPGFPVQAQLGVSVNRQVEGHPKSQYAMECGKEDINRISPFSEARYCFGEDTPSLSLSPLRRMSPTINFQGLAD
jgi:hypothetical protein